MIVYVHCRHNDLPKKKHISTTPAPTGASRTRPAGSAPRHSERAPSDTAAALAATRAPWASGPTTAAAARDSWGPLSPRVSAAAPGGLEVHLHPVITCHHMSSHVTAAQRSFGDGWFGILGGFYRCQIRVLGDLFSMEKNRRFEGVRRCPVSVFDFFWMKESSFYVPTHQYTSYDR